MFIRSIFWSLLLLAPLHADATQENADSVYLGGKVYTVNDGQPIAEAFAVRGDRFLDVGTESEMQKYIGPDTKVHRLEGKCVLPGLIDSHLHWRKEPEKNFLSVGLTSINHMDKATMKDVDQWTAQYKAGKFKIRLNAMLHISTALKMGVPQIGLFNHRLTFRATKVHADNELGPRKASLFEPYSDRPGFYGPWGKHRLGTELVGTDQESQYADTVARLIRLGFQPRTHAIGDYTNHIILNAYERGLKAAGKTGFEVRPVIEHCQILRRQPADDLVRFHQLGVLCNIQAVHATEDMAWVKDRVGSVRLEGAYAWRDLLNSGVTLAGSSDYPISPVNPWFGLHAAVTRQNRENQPAGGWYPRQALTRDEALKSYTLWAAYAEFTETLKGSIETGKLADFIITDRDFMTIPVEEIWKIKVQNTVIGGEVVYSAPREIR